VFIELCSGCGILSATINALGFDVMAVDHNHNKLRLRIKTFNLDLTDILVINATSYW
jgi:predicted RNA methylase